MTSFAGVLAVLGIELGVTTVAVNVLYNHIQTWQEFLAKLFPLESWQLDSQRLLS